jgi:4-hydroxybenzoate polyprenyltransferase
VIRRIHLVVLLSRPPVLLLLGLFAATGLAQGGAADDPVRLAPVLLVVAGYLLSSVIVNDLADAAIDAVNLPGAAARPLVTGAATRSELPWMAAAAAAVSLVAAATIGLGALGVVAGGMALSAAYSLRPVRLSDRGAVASMLLPAGYVAVPFLTGLLASGSPVRGGDLVLLAGLYLGFVGRILLKDFRDVRGDALFGKRTFLVRHGRRATCAASAVGWVVGSVALVGVRDVGPLLVGLQVVWVAVALVLLQRLSTDGGPRRDEALISALAVVGRGMVLGVLVHLGELPGGLQLAVAGTVLAQAVTMARYGPATGLRLPAGWAADATVRSFELRTNGGPREDRS